MTKSKIMSLALASVMALSLAVPAFAAPVDSAGGNSGDIPVKVTAEAPTFSVTMPTAFTINVAADGTVTCPDTLQIVNGSAGAVKVSGITVAAAHDSGWTVSGYDNDFSQYAVNSKHLGMEIVKQKTNDEGGITADLTQFKNDQGDNFMWAGTGNGITSAQHNTIAVPYAAKVSASTQAEQGVTAANVVFTVAWNE